MSDQANWAVRRRHAPLRNAEPIAATESNFPEPVLQIHFHILTQTP